MLPCQSHTLASLSTPKISIKEENKNRPVPIIKQTMALDSPQRAHPLEALVIH